MYFADGNRLHAYSAYCQPVPSLSLDVLSGNVRPRQGTEACFLSRRDPNVIKLVYLLCYFCKFSGDSDINLAVPFAQAVCVFVVCRTPTECVSDRKRRVSTGDALPESFFQDFSLIFILPRAFVVADLHSHCTFGRVLEWIPVNLRCQTCECKTGKESK